MGMLSNIFHKIFPPSHPAVAQAPQGTTVPPAPRPAPTAPAVEPAAVQLTEVDVEGILNDKAKQAGQPLNWRTSIVDLLKLLDLDSSLQSRKELAQELHYSGDMENSASMNVWLHRQVMTKLAQNGGKVPAELKD
ncbi:DUF3597 domain-containing protein [Duganella sp. PWIR1]